jgi:hypothetical protein
MHRKMSLEKIFFLAASAVLFLLSLGMHRASLSGAVSLPPFGQPIAWEELWLFAGILFFPSALVYIHAVRNVREPFSKRGDSLDKVWGGLPDVFYFPFMVLKVAEGSPWWLNAQVVVLLLYLAGATILTPIAPGGASVWLWIVAVFCSVLNLQAFVIFWLNKKLGEAVKGV